MKDWFPAYLLNRNSEITNSQAPSPEPGCLLLFLATIYSAAGALSGSWVT
ncbi:hypothetical protein M2105_000893 [Paenibacillus sp. PastF-1]|nr:hypothetical protein [Paenibacillus sp. PastF-2]MDF9846601.1 hypothetical protein [Paenibacillus sp. PastM-2]MDF9853051.1 hypothetical protein [Paenibacillus sp. PastF-1]MDH6478445.1 hypothetical protein [Paenibacillus sp. PastH-2]MDH6506057.1 hypothetical protein [Paenibacillus sp. PastM-3]